MPDFGLWDLFGYFWGGLAATLTLKTFFALCAGLVMGFFVGILPGVGGPATLAILIPFTFGMDPFSAFALLLGMISVASSTGDMTAILFGIPGESTNAATILDGSPMAKRGEAGRALGAVLMASLFGALIGAFCLAIGIVIVRPLVLSVGYAEFLMLSVAGIAFLASLSANAVFKGMAAGAFGLLLSTVGLSQVTGIERFTFGSLFLWEGLGFIPAILGLFAIPELIDMAIDKSRMPPGQKRVSGAWEGVKDAFRHFGVVFRCSMLSTYIGLIPGMGASIAQWVAYGHAAQSVKPKERVGKGAIECVVGPGAATAATMSGSLIPTIGFGIPGSPQMAILLGAFIVQGLVPGPSMLMPEALGGHLTLTFSMVWMIILSNVIVVAASFFLLNHLAKIAYLDTHILLPFILVLIFIGGFADKNDMMDMWVCLGFGVLGWIMVELDWPRPPLILGLVLGALIESNLFLTMQAYGMSWLTFPSVIGIGLVIILSVAWPFLKPLITRLLGRDAQAAAASGPDFAMDAPMTIGEPPKEVSRFGDTLFTLSMAAVFVAALVHALGWSYSAALMPAAMAVAGLGFTLVQLAFLFIGSRGERFGLGTFFQPSEERRAAFFVGWVYLALLLLLLFLGFAEATGVFLFLYLSRYAKLRVAYAGLLAILGYLVVQVGFVQLLSVPFPQGWLFEYGLPMLGWTS